MQTAKSKQKRVQLDVPTKKAICDLRKDNPKLKQDDLLTLVNTKLGVSIAPATLISILKGAEKWEVLKSGRRLEEAEGGDVDLGKVLCDVKQAILWTCEAWQGMDPQTVRNCWRKVNILPQPWNSELANADERVCGRVDNAAAELSKMIAALQLGDLAVPVEEYVECEPDQIEAQLTDEELVEVVVGGQTDLAGSSSDDDESPDDDDVLGGT